MKKLLTGILVITLILSVMAGCTQQAEKPAEPKATPAKVVEKVKVEEKEKEAEPVEVADETPTVTWMMRERGALAYTNDLKVYEWLGAAGNLVIEPVMVQEDVYMDKLSIMVAGGDLADITNAGNQDIFHESYTPSFELVKDIGAKGLLVPLSDNLDKLPHYKLWLDKYEEYKGGITSADGKIYFASVVRSYNPTSSLGGVIRSDLADTMNFETFDDLYNTLKMMRDKEDEPIWTNRNGILDLNLLSYSFGTSLIEFPYYDQYAEVFINPVATQNYKDAVLFLKKLVEEDILTPEWAAYPEPQWYTDAMDGSTQFWVDNMMNAPTHNNGLKEAGHSGQFEAFIPPSYNGKFYGWAGKSRFSTTGSVISAKTESLDNILQMLDWTYDLQASHDLLYWGEEGITCKQLASGEFGNTEVGVQKTDAFKNTIMEFYGTGENSNWMKVFTDVEYYNDRWFDGARLWAPAGKVYGDNVYTYSIPAVVLNEADSEIFKEIATPLNTFINENVTNFINGKQSMDDFDAFVTRVDEMGGHILVDMYNE